ncbi:MAG: 6-bladed beta-propeller, partial [Cyclonatronaceae bacterium]
MILVKFLSRFIKNSSRFLTMAKHKHFFHLVRSASRLLVFIFVVLAAGCSGKSTSSDASSQHDDLTVIRVDINEGETPLKLSQFVSDISYIPLQTPDDEPIGRIDKIMPRGDLISLFDATRNIVWTFNRRGDFVARANIPGGQGPGEVSNLMNVYVDENHHIHALGVFKIVEYDI